MMNDSPRPSALPQTGNPVAAQRLHEALAAMPLIAILRGIRPDEALGVGRA